MSQKDGGPAFPFVTQWQVTGEHDDTRQAREWMNGMSLRDYFAASALPIVADDVGGFEWEERTSENAYKLADAMLKAREA